MRGLFVLISAVIAAPLTAQDSARAAGGDLRVGERVRVTSSMDRSRRVVGAVMLLAPDSIVLDTTAQRRSIPLFGGGPVPVERFRFATFTSSDVRNIEVSRGSNRLKGTRRGVIWGAVVGTALGLATHLGSGPQIRPLEGAGGDLGRAAVSGLAVGAAAGGVLGFLLPTERWIPVQLPWRGPRAR